MKLFTINSLSEATGFDRRTISKRLGDLQPNADGQYDGPAALARIYAHKGKSAALMAAETRRKEAQASLAELQLAREREHLVEVESVLLLWADIAVAVTQVIKNSSLSLIEKRECLRQIREFKAADFFEKESNEKTN